jgi:phytoene dehydrogenase-like protein
MGAVASELEQAARKAGAEMLTNVDVRALDVKG